MIAKIQSLLKLFSELTGQTVRESYLTQCHAREWLAMGFTEDDLRLMVRYRRQTIEKPHILSAMLKFSFLIGRPDRFDEDLPEARAFFKNNAKPSARDKVLEATGREAKAEKVSKVISKVMSDVDREALVSGLRKLRESL